MPTKGVKRYGDKGGGMIEIGGIRRMGGMVGMGGIGGMVGMVGMDGMGRMGRMGGMPTVRDIPKRIPR